VTTRSKG